jgi:membrane protease YdiL (CAAX protease family)
VVGITVLTTLCLKKAGLEAPVPPLIQAATRSHDPVFWISLAFASVFLAPLAEEFLFRLVLFESLRELNIRLPTLLSAACFAVVHQAPTHLPGLFLLGLILSRAREKSGSLPLPMLIHSMFNAASLTFLWFSRSPGG